MKKITKIITGLFAVLLLFFTASCGPVEPVQVDIHQGTAGFEMSFMQNSPPDEVYVGDTFPLMLDLHNKGAYDIKGGIIVLSVEEEYIGITSKEYQEKVISFGLTGRSVYDPVGGIDRKMIELVAKRIDPQSETHTSTIAVTTCYPYKTEAAATVCIDPDIYGQRQAEKVCTPQTLGMGVRKEGGQELPKGQGAPIAITKIEQRMLSHPEREDLIRPQFMIYVTNMGNGLPMDPGVYQDACKATGIPREAWNAIGVSVYLSDRSIQLNCTPKFETDSTTKAGYVKLEKQEDFVKCTLEEGMPKARGTFTTPLMIDMGYGYTFTISKDVLIRKQV